MPGPLHNTVPAVTASRSDAGVSGWGSGTSTA